MPARELNRDVECGWCGRPIPQGTYLNDLIWNKERRHWYHLGCWNLTPNSPPAAVSSGQGGPKLEPGVKPVASVPVAVPADHLKTQGEDMAQRLFVQIAAWVPIENIETVAKAIREARK